MDTITKIKATLAVVSLLLMGIGGALLGPEQAMIWIGLWMLMIAR